MRVQRRCLRKSRRSQRLGVVEGHTHPLSQMSRSICVYTTMDFKGAEAVTMVRRLEEHSAALSQVASCLSVVMRCGPNAGEDPFAQVMKLITDLINELQAEAARSRCRVDETLYEERKPRNPVDDTIFRARTVPSSSVLDDEVAEFQKICEDSGITHATRAAAREEEISQVPYNDKMVNVPVEMPKIVPTIHAVEKTVEVPQPSVVERLYAVPQVVTRRLSGRFPPLRCSMWTS